ncbi:hypothetical protein Tco_0899940, partial [Tanacetum coccineum]
TKMPSEYQQDYKKTRAYALKIYNDPNMTNELKNVYRALESRYGHKRTQLTTSSSPDSSPSDNGDLPSTKLSLRSYSRALPFRENMFVDQRETRRMFKNLARGLHKFANMLKKGCR